MAARTKEQAQGPTINLKLDGPFGGEEVKPVKLDHNRQSPTAQFSLGWQETLAMPGRLCDVLLQACCYVGSAAFIVSLMRALPPVPLFIVPLVVASVATVSVALIAAWRYPKLRLSLAYRLLLVLLGSPLGVWL